MSMANVGDTVEVHYTGKLTDGTVFDSSEGRAPLEFTLGEGQIIAGFETAVCGMAVGDKKMVEIAPEQAYGVEQPDLAQTVSRDSIPEDLDLELGQQLRVGASEENSIVVTVTDISSDSVTLDANHPLAGKTLIFEIELLAIH